MKYFLLVVFITTQACTSPIVVQESDQLTDEGERIRKETQISGTAVLGLTLIMLFVVSTLANDALFADET